jgi:hypothetical protein
MPPRKRTTKARSSLIRVRTFITLSKPEVSADQNTGGPGGSGVWFIKRLAPYYQAVVGRNHVGPEARRPQSLSLTVKIGHN